MKIVLGKRYKKSKCEGRVIAIDRKHRTHTVVFLSDDGELITFRADGGYYSSGASSEDLQEIPETYWVNVYQDGAFKHLTREIADQKADLKYRIACIEIMKGDWHEV